MFHAAQSESMLFLPGKNSFLCRPGWEKKRPPAAGSLSSAPPFTRSEDKLNRGEMKEWRCVVSAPGYEVSNLGEFRRGGSLLKGTVAHNGYQNIGLTICGKQRWFLAHRVVAEAFLPNPCGFPVVNHKDGDRSNNAAENLEWCSRSHNSKHAWMMKKSRVLDHEYVY